MQSAPASTPGFMALQPYECAPQGLSVQPALRVAFLSVAGETLASHRLRVQIPAEALARAGVAIAADADIAVVGKHNFDPRQLDRYKQIVYDVCDDHFEGSNAEFYTDMCRRAARVTCNSAAMRFRIHQACGVIAHIVPDPWEGPEQPPGWGEGLLWFGHKSNLKDLARIAPSLKSYPSLTVTNLDMDGVIPWSPESQRQALADCAMVVIPTGKNPCKSANRMIESIRAGRFVAAEPLPAYEEFSRWMWVGNIAEGVAWARAHPEEAVRRVEIAQRYIRNRYAPDTIGRQWLKVVSALAPTPVHTEAIADRRENAARVAC
jgi:hypothetical protein